MLHPDYSTVAGGTCIEDLELLRIREGFLDVLGAQRIPDPTTADDSCRQFPARDGDDLKDVIHGKRLLVRRQQSTAFFERAIIDAEGTEVETGGECKEGIGRFYKGTWGFNVLVVSLANNHEPLFLANRAASHSSPEVAAARFDQASA